MTGPSKGNFYKYTGSRKPDGGIIVKDARSQLWEREWLPQLGVMPEFWDAWGDGIHDDILALESARDFILNDDSRPHLQLTYRYRITRQFKIGGAPLSAKDALLYQISNNTAPSYNFNELIKVGNTLPISIKGASRAQIYGDFYPDSLTAIVSIGTSAWQYGGNQYQNTTISGLTIVGNHYFDYNYVGTNSKQVGLIMYGGNHVTVSNLICYGVQDGLISNTQYGFTLDGPFFGNCGRGLFSIGSHASRINSPYADHCDLGFEIVSNACVVTGMIGEQNKRALITNSQNTFIGGYIEQLDQTSGINDFQVQVGYPIGHPFYDYTFYGVEFLGTTVSARNQKHYLIEEGTTSYENVDNVIISKLAFGYNVYKNSGTRIKSSGMSWIFTPIINN
jgi:hypothetical protein